MENTKSSIVTELAEHADFYVGNEHYNLSYEEKQRIWLEKYTQLVIEECISELDYYDGAYHHSVVLKQHFGIE